MTTVKEIYQGSIALYKMKLIAGEDGLSNQVKWMHIIEDPEAGSFLHGNEVVFTAGILCNSPHWLLEYAKNVYEAGASAFVINIGRYLMSIPDEVISYCNKVGFPLFTIPWETRMVDMTRDFGNRIIKRGEKELSLTTHLKNLIFSTGDRELAEAELCRSGLIPTQGIRFLAFSFEDAADCDEYTHEFRANHLDRLIHSVQDSSLSFSYQNARIYALFHSVDSDMNLLVTQAKKEKTSMPLFSSLHLGISESVFSYQNLLNVLTHTCQTLALAFRTDRPIVWYEHLNLHRILMEIPRPVLENFHHQVLSSLIHYDQENQTDLLSFLRFYIGSNGNASEVSQKLYLHRNTVGNQLTKIADLTGYDARIACDFTRFHLAILAEDLF